MNTDTFASALAAIFSELINGAAKSEAYTLNAGDERLLVSLDKLSASDVSSITTTGSSIAAHVDHLRYGLSLMNRWSRGENPFKDANWAVSWRNTLVSDVEWQRLRADLRSECMSWLAALRAPRQVNEDELNGMLGSIAHLAYHLGAIRQINSAA